MADTAFRFVHAAGLNLDEPVGGCAAASAEDRQLARDATLLAWDRVVTACLERDGDFVLLTGDCWRSSSRSLRAGGALLRGLEALGEAGIPVYIALGEHAPLSSWHDLSLPNDVVLLAHDNRERVVIKRNGQPLAQLLVKGNSRMHPIAAPDVDTFRPAEGAKLFTIGVVPGGTRNDRRANGSISGGDQREIRERWGTWAELAQGVQYLALGGESRSTISLASGKAHDPGPTQPLDGRSAGPGGCSLVSVVPGEEIRIDTVPTAPIRFERVSLNFTHDADWDVLIRRMSESCRRLEADASAMLWQIEWQLTLSEALFADLSSAEVQEELLELLDEELGGSGRRRHRLVLHLGAVEEAYGDALWDELERLLAEEGRELAAALRREAAAWTRWSGAYGGELAQMMASCAPESLIAHARGAIWTQWSRAGHVTSNGDPLVAERC